MSSITSALVIGGGIAGPVAATALHKAGVRTTICEAYPGPSDGIGSTLAIAANGMAALDILDAGDAVRAIALPITRTSMSVGGKGLDLPTLTDLEPQQMVERGDLHRVLHDQATAAGVRFDYGKRLVDVAEDGDGVTARFADGSTATADVLIGADGVRSTVRKLIDPLNPDADYTGLLGFGAQTDVRLDLEPNTMHFAFGRRAYYLYWITTDGRVAWGANLPSKEYLSLTEARATSSGHWVSVLRETYRGDEPGERLAAATDADNLVVVGALHIMPPVRTWHRGRMVLVGDAVHCPSNSTGQGASLAIESAIELARCLRDLPDVASAFGAYERLRRVRVETITKRGARLNQTKAPGPVARKMMRVVMPLMFRHMDMEKQLGPELRHHIDWEATVSA